MKKCVKATGFFDGACEGNPGGPMGYGAVLELPNKSFVNLAHYEPACSDNTNNIAEWQAALMAIKAALRHRVTHFELFGDSQLVVNGITGKWKVNAAHLQPLRDQAQALLKGFVEFQAEWIERASNKKADRLAANAIERKLRHSEVTGGA